MCSRGTFQHRRVITEVKTFSSAFGGGEQVFGDLSHALSKAFILCVLQSKSVFITFKDILVHFEGVR